jgi:integrase
MIDLQRNECTIPTRLAKSGRPRTIPILPRSQKILLSLLRSDQIKCVIWHDDNGIHRRYFDLLLMLQEVASGGRTYIFRREVTKLKQKGLKLTAAGRADIAELGEREAWAHPIPDLIWHDLRRTCGCRLLQDYGLSMEAVSKWLGHSCVQLTEKTYAFLEVKHLHDAVGTRSELESRPMARLGGLQHTARSGTNMVTAKTNRRTGWRGYLREINWLGDKD